ncbi:hypothetical protein NDU88_003283 [Pleurodeles waltl]|uniref:Uncharacterized protein n=1 Tax=Pleurodeles waltl TaxID=8319 RepID=A0AAV7KW39_PLEWA|nr:hypothetical protein NDU88_003283 [Pleurodeles waltl]
MQLGDPSCSVARGPPCQPHAQGQRSARAVGHHVHDHPTGGPSIRRSSRSAGGPVLSSFRAALTGPGPFRRCVPVFKVGVRYTRGPFRPTHRAACRVSATARLPAAGPPARPRGSGRACSCCFSLLARMGAEGPHASQAAVTPSSAVSGTRGFPRSALQESLRSPATSRQEGGRPASPAAVGRLPLKRRAIPRPAARPPAHSLSPAPGINANTGRGARRPSPTGSARLALGSAGARVTHTGPRSRSPSICPGGWPRITGEV